MVNLKVYEMMARRGFQTRLQLSEATGIHPSNLGKIVAGNVKALRLETINVLCAVLDCQPGTFWNTCRMTRRPDINQLIWGSDFMLRAL